MSDAPPSDLPASGITAADVNAFLSSQFGGNLNACEAVGDRWATSWMDTSAVVLRPGGIISGPTVFAACDSALFYACFTVTGIVPMALTSELSIRFLRPARGPELRARAVVHHAGKRSMIGSIVAWTDDPDRPVAAAQGTYVLPLERPLQR